MNYPIWHVPLLGGPTLIALVAIVHVFVAQIAVGGGFFLAFADWRAQRTRDPELLAFVRAHTHLFLLLSMVFGAVTGVGIWFTIQLVHPAATSLLIHEFVFGWATEWVFFLVEIAALLVYHYAFERLAPRRRLAVAMVYAGSAWASLFVINGILSFMLTPGAWPQTGSFWDGFFNPSFWPSLAFRTCLSLSLAGLFGLVSALRARFAGLRGRLVRLGVAWLLLPAVGLAGSGWWYLAAVPEELRERALGANPEALPFLYAGPWAALALAALALALLVLPRRPQQVVLGLMMAAALTATGSYEYLREIARKPWIIPGVMYANGLRPADIAAAREEGLLELARWDFTAPIAEEDPHRVGSELFDLQCLACHSRGGLYNDVLPLLRPYTAEGLKAWLQGMGSLHGAMPPFAGTPTERDALATWLGALVGPPAEPEPAATPPRAADLPAQELGDYQLLAWSDLGMHCVTDAESLFLLLPPANTLEAVLIRRGGHPVKITEGVTLRYALPERLRHPSRHTGLWEHAEALLGAPLAPEVGVAGNGPVGTMTWHEDSASWRAEAIPVLPYGDDGGYDPYPLVTVEALDADGAVLARTQVVLPVSTEIGCRTCHGGPWRYPELRAGLSDETARRILALHDDHEGTALLAEAEAGRPQACAACHADPALGAAGREGVLSLSAALHGHHAVGMHLERGAACAACHPSRADGITRCYRGLHAARGLDCALCHGVLADHAT
ncbi:MAG: cytochrome ubiquinol oxidase subunit I, partial [Pseudomonadota bacterium]